MGKSYGFIEIPSTTAALDALDIMCKTADVCLLYTSQSITIFSHQEIIFTMV